MANFYTYQAKIAKMVKAQTACPSMQSDQDFFGIS